jgi:osmotically-inducible protein OsmY
MPHSLTRLCLSVKVNRKHFDYWEKTMSEYNDYSRRRRNEEEEPNRQRDSESRRMNREMRDYDYYGTPDYRNQGSEQGGGRNERDYYYAGSQQTSASRREGNRWDEEDYGTGNYRTSGAAYGQGGMQGNWSQGGMGMNRGQHTGKGPQGYKRSKDRIMEEICDILMQHGGVDASNISVNVDDNGEVTLEGTVSDRQQKRMAEDAIENVSGVNEVHNRLRVQQDSGAQQRTSQTTGGMQNRDR